MARVKQSGAHLGPRRTISARQVAEMLGLSPEPPAPQAPPLSPAQHRAKMEGKPLPPGDETLEIVTVPAGRDVLDLWGGDSIELPVGAEVGLAPPKPKREHNLDDEATPSPAAEVSRPLASAEADELRAQYRAHVEKITAMAQDARGDAAKEAKAAAEVRASAELGERLKAKLGGNL